MPLLDARGLTVQYIWETLSAPLALATCEADANAELLMLNPPLVDPTIVKEAATVEATVVVPPCASVAVEKAEDAAETEGLCEGSGEREALEAALEEAGGVEDTTGVKVLVAVG